MNLEKIIQDGRLLGVLREHKLEIDTELLERLEIAVDGTAEEIMATFGGEHKNLDTIKLGIATAKEEVLDAVFVAMFENVARFHVEDQKQVYECFGEGVKISNE